MLEELQEERTPTLSWDDYIKIIRRRRWWLVLPMFLCWGIVWGIGWLLPSVYRSETLILIEQQKVPEQYVVSNVSVDLQERLQSMSQQILSRTRLERIIDRFNLYPKGPGGLSTTDPVEQMRKDIAIELVQAPGRPGDLTAFKISYSATTPQLAQQVASELTSLFIDENLQSQQQLSESTTTFLGTQLNDARTVLEQQEAKVREFKAQNLGQLPSQLQSNVQILSGMQAQLQGLTDAVNRAQQQRLYLQSLLEQYRAAQAATGTGGSADTPEALDKELERLQVQLANVKALYTDENPDVRHTEEQIAKTKKLKQQMADEIAANEKAQSSGSGKAAEPVPAGSHASSSMMQITSQLKANELEIRDYQHQIKDLEAKIGEYQQRLNMTPMREQQLADITRGYEESQANYDSLLKKQMQSQLATNLEKRQQGEQFRIIDPPSLPKKPSSPNHFELSLIALGAGLLLGLGITALAELIDARIRAEKDLKDLVPARVLVGIPHLATPGEEKQRVRRHWMEWAAAFVIVVSMVAGNLVSYFKG
jgi:succinoglycan biosynthesis transport protein ExoP